MPAHYTHYYIARKVLDELSPIITEHLQPYLPVYFFGAQGADFCFFYQVANFRRKNFGSYLHRDGGFTAFQVLKALSTYDPVLFAYTLGYITHYAADITFHPCVYQATKNPIEHSRIENALDRRFLGYNLKEYGETPAFQRILSSDILDDLFFAYAAIAAKCGFPPLKKNAFLRAVSIFNAYLPISSKLSGTTAKKAPDNAKNNKKQKNTTSIEIELFRGNLPETLFENAVSYAVNLINEFLLAISHRTPLSKETFGRNYLSGI